MFIDSPELYDAIYHFKNYARECDRLRSLINEVVPGARTILDVACGTGAHAKFLKHHYAVDGIDNLSGDCRALRSQPAIGHGQKLFLRTDRGCGDCYHGHSHRSIERNRRLLSKAHNPWRALTTERQLGGGEREIRTRGATRASSVPKDAQK
jgi:hypothetical protein